MNENLEDPRSLHVWIIPHNILKPTSLDMIMNGIRNVNTIRNTYLHAILIGSAKCVRRLINYNTCTNAHILRTNVRRILNIM